jgi:DNA-binding transcriptional MerR regulator
MGLAVARRAGLQTSAIRYYERFGLLSAPERRGGPRQYAEDVLFRLKVIRFARDSGFTLREIRGLFAGKPFSKTMRRFARDKVVALDGVVERARLMQSLLGAALRCTCLTLEDCGRRLRRLDPT